MKYIMLSALFLGLFAGNLLFLQSLPIGIILGIFFIIYFGGFFGRRLAPKEHPLNRVVIGSAALIAILSLYGSAIYYLGELTQTTVAIGIILVPFFVWIIQPRTDVGSILTQPLLEKERSRTLPNRWIIACAVCVAVLAFAAFSLLINHPITSPIRSPWLLLPTAFFLPVFLIALFTAVRPNKWLLVLFFFLTISVVLLSYPLGYGFDPFIHKATEQHIFETGTITPKPLYYVGQYALVLIAAHGFFLPIDLIDNLLVPLLAALLIPLFAYIGFSHVVGKQRAVIASLAVFLIPLTSFINTTPQGLADLWTLLAIFSSLPILIEARTGKPRSYMMYAVPAIFVLAALVTHPLAGIPVAIYLMLVITQTLLPIRFGQVAKPAVIIVGSVLLPIVFVAEAAIAHLSISFNASALTQTSLPDLFHLSLFLQNHFHTFLDAAYSWEWNRMIILVALVIAAIIFIHRKKLPRSLFIPAIAAAMMLVSYVLLNVIQFDFLIDYERSTYGSRVFTMAQFLIVPLLGIILVKIYDTPSTKPLPLRAGFSILMAMILTASVYTTYPRHDNYEISRGFNVGVSDYDTVHYIHDQNTTIDYVVLANQAVSSAAMDEYGFAQYYKGDIFYYPIPTGGPMYQIYLDMVNGTPTKIDAIKAMDLAEVNKAYFVVNDYWFNADKIIENAKREATSWTAIDSGATYVFEFER